MRNDELKEYLDEKRRQGLDEIGCWQVRIAANMGISREKLDFISIPGLSFTNREWTYLALLDQVPVLSTITRLKWSVPAIAVEIALAISVAVIPSVMP